MLYHKNNLLGIAVKLANGLTRITVGLDANDCAKEAIKVGAKAINEVKAFGKEVGVNELATEVRSEAANYTKAQVVVLKNHLKEATASLMKKDEVSK